VETLFTLTQPDDQAVEGLAIATGANGPVLNVLVIHDPDNTGQNLSNPNLNVTLYRHAVSAVPEPAAWALMPAGHRRRCTALQAPMLLRRLHAEDALATWRDTPDGVAACVDVAGGRPAATATDSSRSISRDMTPNDLSFEADNSTT
jgi:hypothetical protein